MRIVAGQFRGRKLKTPSWEGLRPTSDRLRETLFDILGPSIQSARVLDGFAGTGAVGIEALSRGASHVAFVDDDPRAVKLIEENLRQLGLEPAIIRAGFADAARRLRGTVFDLVLLDPPYAASAPGSIEVTLEAAAPLVAVNGRLVIEHAARQAMPASHAGLACRRTVTAGDSALSFYEHS
jgi:16S rRNA (guanine966-N2)-methyltransferase